MNVSDAAIEAAGKALASAPAGGITAADFWQRLARAAIEAAVPFIEAEAWDECCEAFAWAMKEEPTHAPVSWLAYVHDNNPYRIVRDDL